MIGFLQFFKKKHQTLNSKINIPHGSLHKEHLVMVQTTLPRTGFTINHKCFDPAPHYSDHQDRTYDS